jgi:predicted HAD superfamily phosphohydrolase YqeG
VDSKQGTVLCVVTESTRSTVELNVRSLTLESVTRASTNAETYRQLNSSKRSSWRRARSWRVDAVAEVEPVLAILERRSPGAVEAVVFDVENTIVRPEPSAAELAEAIELATALVLRALPSASVLFVSNGSLRHAGDDRAIAQHLVSPGKAFILHRNAKKPRTTLDLAWPAVVVVGDQLLTDGLLAVRHGATFVELHLGHGESSMSRLNRVLGELSVRVLLFRRRTQERLR